MDTIIKNVVSTMPPDAWVRTIRDAYNVLPAPASTPAPAPAPRTPAPLRPGAAGANGTGGIAPAPNSAMDAVNMALGGM
jgi:hypothetical protein